MFVRKKKNKSGTTSIVVVDKSSGRYREVKNIGVSSNEQEIASFIKEGEKWIQSCTIGDDIFDTHKRDQEEEQLTLELLDNIEKIKLNGAQLIINHVYDSIGFDEIKDKELRYLVTARLAQPLSKSATVEYLKSYFDEDTSLNKIYRYMDKLYNTQQEKIQQISVNHTKGLFGGKVGLVFYDVTTLYFETEKRDDLREPGFSKDGKHSLSQLVLGLLVSRDGYPLSYSLFNGSQYEGYTMLPVIEDFISRFKLEDFVVVADSGLMNAKNIKLLDEGGYKKIIRPKFKKLRNRLY